MEVKKLKKSFALLTTIVLVVLFSFISIRLVETELLSSNLNTLKYLHLQANIHIDKINEYVKTHDDIQIKNFKDSWSDDRFEIDIVKDENNSSIYYTSINTVDQSHVRLSQKIIK